MNIVQSNTNCYLVIRYSKVDLMFTFIFHSLFLLFSVSLTYLWTKNSTLSSFNLQAVGLLILFYFGSKLLSGKRDRVLAILDAVIFTSLILFLVLTSGGVHSPLFFLLYFLLFGGSLLFEPFQAVLLSLILIILFSLDLSFRFDEPAIINLVTLFFITPLASLFGRKYLQSQHDSGKIMILNKIISEEETDTLLWLSTKAKPTLVSLLDTTSLIISSNLLPFRLQEKLKSLHRDLISLHVSANDLENDIEKHEQE